MSADEKLLRYVLRLGDNALITGQRMIERVTGEPELEEELANANFALDYIGQARLFYTYAAELEGEGMSEDHFAYRRDRSCPGRWERDAPSDPGWSSARTGRRRPGNATSELPCESSARR